MRNCVANLRSNGESEIPAVTPPAAVGSGGNETPDAELDDHLTLSTEQAEQIGKFRQDVQLCGTDAEKYELCVRVRNQLLEQHTGLKLLIATIERVMCTECPEYKRRKEKKRSDEADAEEWDRFIGVAAAGSALKSKCLGPLKEVSRVWGRDVVQRYQLVAKGEFYCKRACATAREIPDFRETVLKLNRVMLRRYHLPGRHHIAASVNPIAPIDLKNIRAWSHKDPFIMENDPDRMPLPFAPLAAEELPSDFGYDKFGLLVRKEFAVEPSRPVSEEASRPKTSQGSRDDAEDRAAAGGVTAPSPAGASGSPSAHSSTGDSSGDSSDHHPDSESASSCAENATPETVADSTGTDGPARNLRSRKQPVSYRGAAGGMAKSKSSHSLAITTTLRRCCPTEVPDELLSLLDGQSASREALQQCLSYQEQLCPLHLKLFAKRTAVFLSNTIFSLEAKDQITADHPEPIPIRRRRSLSDISQYAPPAKRHRPDSPCPSTAAQEGGRAYPRNTHRNEAYRSQIISELSQKLAQNRTIQGSHGEQTDRLMLQILRKAKQPNTDEKNGPIEAHFLAGEEAAAVVESRSDDVPIFTHNQQSFQWTDRERPIAQLFQRIGDLNRSVSVQMPSRPSDKDSFEKRTLREIRGRFLGREPTDDPWNILDLRSPLPPGVLLPQFLMGPNCQLHLGIRDALLMADSAERITASAEERRMWRDDQEMALLSEGSHNTAPHTDSDGKATWLTVQEGLYLVVWMSNPTPEQWTAWVADPARYAGGQWRYEVLGPGQTVFFRPGAVHGISRRQQTLVLAGHVLLWSDIVRWMEVFKVQMRNPHITNEDMGSSAYLVKAVKRLVSNRVRDGKVEQLGGQEALDRFFALVEEFEQEQKEFEKDRKMDQKELEKKLKELKKEVEKKQKELDKMQEELQKLSQSNRKDGK